MYPIAIAVIVVLLAGVVFSNSGKRRFNSRYMFIFRIFFPSWKFFDDSGVMYAITYRTCAKMEEMESTHWVACPPKLERSWYQLLVNPKGNIALACDSVVQHLSASVNEVIDNDSHVQLSNSVSYKVAQNMVLYFCRQTGDEHRFYQFKLTEHSRDTADTDVMISPIYGC